ncbi:hypothetical protein [Sphingobium sp. HWE2-09]|uniref:hypothetical protein n=1 Tax=Sphingobium sp. HWE2-09 TaxID=3108390 RepID=UPI002DC42A4D|nr:hypothetical protein [Sphingobium sp. HWE2-09]
MSDVAGQVSRVIAKEEHAWRPGLREALLNAGGDETISAWSSQQVTSRQLLDVGDERIARMDTVGVDFQVLSVTAPGTQKLSAPATGRSSASRGISTVTLRP